MREFADRAALVAIAERIVLEEAHRIPESRWRPSDEDGPDIVAAVAEARERLAGERRAIVLRKIEQAVNCRNRCEANNQPIPMWARNWLAPLDAIQGGGTNDETENLDEALALLSQAVA
ncbi:hypothetical protein [Bradyrhizobium cenepequi]|uniref:hypothetical protein n=1 Tax=Bradyrhizobium cenepequi TaxID=2821403 RepID=UPI001CE28B7F|nr:hypothetical protein [Bradyrhizobium cenepequi]MCA6109605.1 hypothetical protein [Bradyrhizobium cenepequi]